MSRYTTLLLAVAALVAPGAASAHGRTGLATGYVSTVAALKPNVLGVSVVVLGGDDRLRLSNYSGKTIVILGYQGEPYLRFADGAVYENLRSPAVRLNRFRLPRELEVGSPDAHAPPRWRQVSHESSFEWHDHRIHWPATRPPAVVLREPDEVHRIFDWRVPGRAAGRPFAITGFLGYAPQTRTHGGGGTPAWVIGAASGGAVLALATFGAGARRRRRRAPAQSPRAKEPAPDSSALLRRSSRRS